MAELTQLLQQVQAGDRSARERIAEKRGSGQRPLTLSTQVAEQLPEGEDEILRVHDALESLHRVDPRLAQLVKAEYDQLRNEFAAKEHEA